MTTERAVRAASAQFYAALERMTNGDAGPMAEIWSHRDDVTTMHPIGGREVGWEAVRGSGEAVAAIAEDADVDCVCPVTFVGELAYELVTEQAAMTLGGRPVTSEFRATNVYRLEDDEWRIVHHHVDADEEYVEIVGGLQTDG
jgi:ketosteroid isomerase-like protein